MSVRGQKEYLRFTLKLLSNQVNDIMKRLYAMAGACLLATGVMAQNYNSVNSTGTSDPYAYNAAGTTVLGIPSSDVMSSAQTLPFAWNFYGNAVTSYLVSDNGYITFDTGNTTSDPANTSIPDASGPNNAIYAFWDDLDVVAGSGSPDEVVSFNYGTAPNRTHVIQWYSVTPVGGSTFLYAAIRIHECGDFDIVHNFGNATGMSATVGCEDATGANGTMAEGPNFGYPSVGSAGGDDNVYTFFWGGINYDMAITSSDLSGFVSLGNNTVSGSIANNGATAVTSFDLHYTVDGGAAVTDNITGVNIATGASFNFSHGTPWNVATGGQTSTLCIWADNINGNTDERTCNDQWCGDLFSNNGTTATRNVVIEEFTGSWCGWCPDGAVVMDDIIANNPAGRVIGISIHDNDAMEFSEGIRSAFGVSAYPNGMVDRKVFAGEPDEPHSRGAWTANTATSLASYTPVGVSIAHTFNTTTRVIDIDVTADFVDYASGDMRIVLDIVEDGVTGTGTGYDQVNYLNTQAGHPFENAGDPIVGYVHNHTLRANPAGAFGNSGVIPATVAPNDSYTENFSYTLPANFDENNIKIVAFVAYAGNGIGEREIMNGMEVDLSVPVGIMEGHAVQDINLYPNPADANTTLSFVAEEATASEVLVYNLYGEVVSTVQTGTLALGENRINIPTNELASGIYMVTIKTGNHAYTRKLIVR